MTNGQNAVRGRHLDSLAADARRFTLEKNLELTEAIQADLEELGGASYANFVGATSISGGVTGLVPAPAIGDNKHFLRGDGTWARADSGNVVLDTVASAVEGALWKSSVNDVPLLKLRHGDYEYNFQYDSITYLGGSSSATETVEPDTYILGTASVSNDGGIWYEITDNVPMLWFHSGNFNYGINYSTITYKGDTTNMVCYLPFDSAETVDAYGNTWAVVGEPTIQNRALYLNGSSYLQLDDVSTLLGNSSMYSIDFWASPSANTGTFFSFFNSLVDVPAQSTNGWIKLDLYSGKLRFVGQHNDVETTYPYPLNSRHHFAMTYNGTTYKIYGDGQLLLTKDRTTSACGAFQIGSCSVDTVTGGLTGSIDHFRVFKDVVLWTDNFTPPTAADYL